MTDSTMRSLLEVHRAELNDRDTEIAKRDETIGYRDRHIEELNRKNGQLVSEVKRHEDARERQRHTAAEAEAAHAAKVAKLDDIIESLKLELAAEREAHTEVRAAATTGKDQQ